MSSQTASHTQSFRHQVTGGFATNSQTLDPREAAPTKATRRNVLIIDDDADLRSLLSLVVNDKGYEVVEAEDGQSGLETARTNAFDLVLVDFDLPLIHGLEVVRQLRQHPRLEALPIIMMTSHGNRVHDSAVNAGCDQFLPKTIDFDKLYEMMEYFAPATPQTVEG